MANIHPTSIFRWEDAASLEHACWQCPTKANSPRALQTCYGIHSMPCTSYHPTMHAVGAAHRCSGCVTTREMHEARHREIAELVGEYKALEAPPPPPATPTRTPLLERNVNTVAAPANRRERNVLPYTRGGIDDNPLVIAADDDEPNHGHNINDGQENDQDHNTIPEDDSTSLSSYTLSSADTNTNTTPRKPTKAEIRNLKRARKSAKSASKALKNQSKNLASITSSDVAYVATILHGDDHQDGTLDDMAHPLATDRTIEDVISRNLGFVRSIQAHKQALFRSVAVARRESKERKRIRKGEEEGTSSGLGMEEVVAAIMIRLGLPASVVAASAAGGGAGSGNNGTPMKPTTNGGGRKRASSNLSLAASATSSPFGTTSSNANGSVSRPAVAIACKMRTAIRVDLEKHENEVHARYVRAGGFWRYVGKTVFERMTEVAGELDVKSGERWESKRKRESGVDAGGKIVVGVDVDGDDDDGQEVHA